MSHWFFHLDTNPERDGNLGLPWPPWITLLILVAAGVYGVWGEV